MAEVIEVPVDFVQDVAQLRLPPPFDRQMQFLMDLNTDGELTADALDQLSSLVEWSESVSLLRARAMHLLREQVQNG